MQQQFFAVSFVSSWRAGGTADGCCDSMVESRQASGWVDRLVRLGPIVPRTSGWAGWRI